MVFSLPDVAGRYPVGATTFVLPLKHSHLIGQSEIRLPQSLTGKKADQLQPALKLEEVAFTAFYPAQIEAAGHRHSHLHRWLGWATLGGNAKKGMDWLIRPLRETLQGYEHFGGTPYPAWVGAVIRPFLQVSGALIKIPVYPNAPLLSSEESFTGASWPLVIFSHGLAGSRTTYSHICQRIAATGRIVLAIEHRDGTGPAVYPRSPETGQTQAKFYIKPEDVVWPRESKGNDRELPDDALASKWEKDNDPLKLRDEQLEFRRHEVYLTYTAFCALVRSATDDDTGGLRVIDGADIDWASWRGAVECAEPVLAGHSFGGATVFSILSHPQPVPNLAGEEGDVYAQLNVKDALILDPWLEPIPSPGPAPYHPTESAPHDSGGQDGNQGRHPRMLVLQSEGFTLWDDHFERLRQAVKQWKGGRILTLVRAQHISFSDFPLLVPDRFQSAPAVPLALLIDRLVVAFLEGKMDMKDESSDMPNMHLGEELEDIPTRKMETFKDAENEGKRKLVGAPGDVVVH